MQSLVLCSIFAFIYASTILFVAVYYFCKHRREQERLKQCADQMRPEEVEKVEKKAKEVMDVEAPHFASPDLPQIILKPEELSPGYHEFESARTSSMSSHEDNSEQQSRSVQELL